MNGLGFTENLFYFQHLSEEQRKTVSNRRIIGTDHKQSWVFVKQSIRDCGFCFQGSEVDRMGSWEGKMDEKWESNGKLDPWRGLPLSLSLVRQVPTTGHCIHIWSSCWRSWKKSSGRSERSLGPGSSCNSGPTSRLATMFVSHNSFQTSHSPFQDKHGCSRPASFQFLCEFLSQSVITWYLPYLSLWKIKFQLS